MTKDRLTKMGPAPKKLFLQIATQPRELAEIFL
jgi:hypothetical protein